MRKKVIATLAGLVLGGCITNKAIEQAPQETDTMNPEEVAIQYEESMENLKQTKEGESNQNTENFTNELEKYNVESDSRYQEVMKAVEKEEKRLRKYKKEGQ